jgi:RNA polymerase sigma factor (sigma-70 family)
MEKRTSSVQRHAWSERLVAVRDPDATGEAPSLPTERSPDINTLAAYDGFAAFYADHYSDMVRLAAAVLRDSHLAEEAAQDAFASLYGRWERVEDPISYLRRSLINRCRDVIRAEQSRRRLLGRLSRSSQTAVLAASDPMDDAINRLGANQRTAIVLRFYAGLSPDEIATALGRNPSTVRSWLRRAISTLRKELHHD